MNNCGLRVNYNSSINPNIININGLEFAVKKSLDGKIEDIVLVDLGIDYLLSNVDLILQNKDSLERYRARAFSIGLVKNDQEFEEHVKTLNIINNIYEHKEKIIASLNERDKIIKKILNNFQIKHYQDSSILNHSTKTMNDITSLIEVLSYGVTYDKNRNEYISIDDIDKVKNLYIKSISYLEESYYSDSYEIIKYINTKMNQIMLSNLPRAIDLSSIIDNKTINDISCSIQETLDISVPYFDFYISKEREKTIERRKNKVNSVEKVKKINKERKTIFSELYDFLREITDNRIMDAVKELSKLKTDSINEIILFTYINKKLISKKLDFNDQYEELYMNSLLIEAYNKNKDIRKFEKIDTELIEYALGLRENVNFEDNKRLINNAEKLNKYEFISYLTRKRIGIINLYKNKIVERLQKDYEKSFDLFNATKDTEIYNQKVKSDLEKLLNVLRNYQNIPEFNNFLKGENIREFIKKVKDAIYKRINGELGDKEIDIFLNGLLSTYINLEKFSNAQDLFMSLMNIGVVLARAEKMINDFKINNKTLDRVVTLLYRYKKHIDSGLTLYDLEDEGFLNELKELKVPVEFIEDEVILKEVVNIYNITKFVVDTNLEGLVSYYDKINTLAESIKKIEDQINRFYSKDSKTILELELKKREESKKKDEEIKKRMEEEAIKKKEEEERKRIEEEEKKRKQDELIKQLVEEQKQQEQQQTTPTSTTQSTQQTPTTVETQQQQTISTTQPVTETQQQQQEEVQQQQVTPTVQPTTEVKQPTTQQTTIPVETQQQQTTPIVQQPITETTTQQQETQQPTTTTTAIVPYDARTTAIIPYTTSVEQGISTIQEQSTTEQPKEEVKENLNVEQETKRVEVYSIKEPDEVNLDNVKNLPNNEQAIVVGKRVENRREEIENNLKRLIDYEYKIKTIHTLVDYLQQIAYHFSTNIDPNEKITILLEKEEKSKRKKTVRKTIEQKEFILRNLFEEQKNSLERINTIIDNITDIIDLYKINVNNLNELELAKIDRLFSILLNDIISVLNFYYNNYDEESIVDKKISEEINKLLKFNENPIFYRLIDDLKKKLFSLKNLDVSSNIDELRRNIDDLYNYLYIRLLDKKQEYFNRAGISDIITLNKEYQKDYEFVKNQKRILNRTGFEGFGIYIDQYKANLFSHLVFRALYSILDKRNVLLKKLQSSYESGSLTEFITILKEDLGDNYETHYVELMNIFDIMFEEDIEIREEKLKLLNENNKENLKRAFKEILNISEEEFDNEFKDINLNELINSFSNALSNRNLDPNRAPVTKDTFFTKNFYNIINLDKNLFLINSFFIRSYRKELLDTSSFENAFITLKITKKHRGIKNSQTIQLLTKYAIENPRTPTQIEEDSNEDINENLLYSTNNEISYEDLEKHTTLDEALQFEVNIEKPKFIVKVGKTIKKLYNKFLSLLSSKFKLSSLFSRINEVNNEEEEIIIVDDSNDVTFEEKINNTIDNGITEVGVNETKLDEVIEKSHSEEVSNISTNTTANQVLDNLFHENTAEVKSFANEEVKEEQSSTLQTEEQATALKTEDNKDIEAKHNEEIINNHRIADTSLRTSILVDNVLMFLEDTRDINTVKDALMLDKEILEVLVLNSDKILSYIDTNNSDYNTIINKSSLLRAALKLINQRENYVPELLSIRKQLNDVIFDNFNNIRPNFYKDKDSVDKIDSLLRKYEGILIEIQEDIDYYEDKYSLISSIENIKSMYNRYLGILKKVIEENNKRGEIINSIHKINNFINNLEKIKSIKNKNFLDEKIIEINETQNILNNYYKTVRNFIYEENVDLLTNLIELNRKLNSLKEKFHNLYEDYKSKKVSKIATESLFKNSIHQYLLYLQNRYSIHIHDNVFRPFKLTNPVILKDLALKKDNLIHLLNISGIEVNDNNLNEAIEFIKNEFGNYVHLVKDEFLKTQVLRSINFDKNTNLLPNVVLKFSEIIEYKLLHNFINSTPAISPTKTNEFSIDSDKRNTKELLARGVEILLTNEELIHEFFSIVNEVSNMIFENYINNFKQTYNTINLIINKGDAFNKGLSLLFNKVKLINPNISNQEFNSIKTLLEFYVSMRIMINPSTDILQRYSNQGLNAKEYLEYTTRYAISYIENYHNAYKNNNIYKSYKQFGSAYKEDNKEIGYYVMSLDDIVPNIRLVQYLLINPLVANNRIGNLENNLLQNVDIFFDELYKQGSKNITFNIVKTETKGGERTFRFESTTSSSITQFFHTFLTEFVDKNANREESLNSGVVLDRKIRTGKIKLILNPNRKFDFNFGDKKVVYQHQRGVAGTLFFNNKNFDTSNTTKQVLLYNQLKGEYEKVEATLELGLTYVPLEESMREDSAIKEIALHSPHLLNVRPKKGVRIISRGASEYYNKPYSRGDIKGRIITLHTIEIEKDGKRYNIHFMKQTYNFKESEEDFIINVYNERHERLNINYRDLIDVELPLFALLDNQVDNQGNAKFFEIVTDYHLMGYLNNFKDKLERGEKVLIDVSLEGFTENSNFGELTAQYPKNVIGSQKKMNYVSSINEVDEEERISMYDEEEDFNELTDALNNIGNKSDTDRRNNYVIFQRAVGDRGKLLSSKQYFLRMVNRLDFNKPIITSIEPTARVLFVDYKTDRKTFRNSGLAIAGALNQLLYDINNQEIRFGDYLKRIKELKKEYLRLREEYNKHNIIVAKAYDNMIKERTEESEDIFEKEYKKLNEIDDNIKNIEKQYNELYNEYFRNIHYKMKFNSDVVNTDLIRVLILPTSELMNMRRQLNAKNESLSFSIRTDLAKNLYQILNRKIFNKESVNQLKIGDNNTIDINFISNIIKIYNSSSSSNLEQFLKVLSDELGFDLQQFILDNLNKTFTELDEKNNSISYTLNEEDKKTIFNDIAIAIHNQFEMYVKVFTPLISDNKDEQYINAEDLGDIIARGLITIEQMERDYNNLLFAYSTNLQNNVRPSIAYLKEVIKGSDIIKRYKANVHINGFLYNESKIVYKGRDVAEKNVTDKVYNSVEGQIASNESNKSRYLLLENSESPFIPIRSLEFDNISMIFYNYVYDRHKLSNYDLEAINILYRRSIEILKRIFIDRIYNNDKLNNVQKSSFLLYVISDGNSDDKYLLSEDDRYTLLPLDKCLEKIDNLLNDENFKKLFLSKFSSEVSSRTGLKHRSGFAQLYDYFDDLQSNANHDSSVGDITNSLLIMNLFIIPNTASFISPIDGKLKPAYESKENKDTIKLKYKVSKRDRAGYYVNDKLVEPTKQQEDKALQEEPIQEEKVENIPQQVEEVKQVEEKTVEQKEEKKEDIVKEEVKKEEQEVKQEQKSKGIITVVNTVSSNINERKEEKEKSIDESNVVLFERNESNNIEFKKQLFNYYKDRLNNLDKVTFLDVLSVFTLSNKQNVEDNISILLDIILDNGYKNLYLKGNNPLYRCDSYVKFTRALKVKYTFDLLKQIEDKELKELCIKYLYKKSDDYIVGPRWENFKDIDDYIKAFDKHINLRVEELTKQIKKESLENFGLEAIESIYNKLNSKKKFNFTKEQLYDLLLYNDKKISKEEIIDKFIELEKRVIDRVFRYGYKVFFTEPYSKDEFKNYIDYRDVFSGSITIDIIELGEEVYDKHMDELLEMSEKLEESFKEPLNIGEGNEWIEKYLLKFIYSETKKNNAELIEIGTPKDSIKDREIKNSLIYLIGDEEELNTDNVDNLILDIDKFLYNNINNFNLNELYFTEKILEKFNNLLLLLNNDKEIFKKIMQDIINKYIDNKNINIIINLLDNKYNVKLSESIINEEELSTTIEKEDIEEKNDESIMQDDVDSPTFVKKSPVELVSQVVHNFFKENVYVDVNFEYINIKNILSKFERQRINLNDIFSEENGIKKVEKVLNTNNSTIDEILFTLVNYNVTDIFELDTVQFVERLIKNFKNIINYNYLNNNKDLNLNPIHANVIICLLDLYNNIKIYDELSKKKELTKEEQETLYNIKRYYVPVAEGIKSMIVSFYDTDNMNPDKQNVLGYTIDNNTKKLQFTTKREKVKFKNTVSPNNKVASISYPSLFTESVDKINNLISILSKHNKAYNDINLSLSRLVYQSTINHIDSDVKEIETLQRYYLYSKYRNNIYALLNTSVSSTPYTVKTDVLVGAEIGLLSELDNIFSVLESFNEFGIDFLNNNGNIYVSKDTLEYELIERLFNGYHYIKLKDGNIRINVDNFDTRYSKDISFVKNDLDANYNKNRRVIELFHITASGDVKISELGKELYKFLKGQNYNAKLINEFISKINKEKTISNLEFLNKLLDNELYNENIINFRARNLQIFENYKYSDFINNENIKNAIIKTHKNIINFYKNKLENNEITLEQLHNIFLLSSFLLDGLRIKNNEINKNILKRLKNFLNDEKNFDILKEFKEVITNNKSVIKNFSNELTDIENSIINHILNNSHNYRIIKTYKYTSKDLNRENILSIDNILSTIDKLIPIYSRYSEKNELGYKDEDEQIDYPESVSDFDLEHTIKYLVHSDSISTATYVNGGDLNIKTHNKDGSRILFPLLSFSKRLQQHYTPGSLIPISKNIIQEGDLNINNIRKRVIVKQVKESNLNNRSKDNLKKTKFKINDGQGEILVDEMIAIVASKGLLDINEIGNIKKSLYSYSKFNFLDIFFESLIDLYGTEEIYKILELMSTNFSTVGIQKIEEIFNERQEDKFKKINDLYNKLITLFKENKKIDIKDNEEYNNIIKQIEDLNNKLKELEEKQKELKEKNDKKELLLISTNIKKINKEISDLENSKKVLDNIYSRYNEYLDRYEKNKNLIDELDIVYNEFDMRSDIYALSFIKNYLCNRKIGVYGNTSIGFINSGKEYYFNSQNLSIKSSFGIIIPALIYDKKSKNENDDINLYREVLRYNKNEKEKGSNNFVTYIVNNETTKRFQSKVITSFNNINIDDYAYSFDARIVRDMIEGKASFNNTNTPIGNKTVQLLTFYKDEDIIKKGFITFDDFKIKYFENVLGNIDSKQHPNLFNLIKNKNLNIHKLGKAMNNVIYLVSYKTYRNKLYELGLDKDIIDYSKFIDKIIDMNSDIDTDEDIKVILDEYMEYESYYKSYNDSIYKLESVLNQLKTIVTSRVPQLTDSGRLKSIGFEYNNKKYTRALSIALLTGTAEEVELDPELNKYEEFNDKVCIKLENGKTILINKDEYKDLKGLIKDLRVKLLNKYTKSKYIKLKEKLDNDIAYLPMYDKIVSSLAKKLIKASMHLKVNGGFEVNFSIYDGLKYKDSIKFDKDFMIEVAKDYVENNIEKYKDKQLTEKDYINIFNSLDRDELYNIIIDNKDNKYTDIAFVSGDMKVGTDDKGNVITASKLVREGKISEVVGITVRIPQSGRESQSSLRVVGVYPFGITGMASTHPYTVMHKGEDFDFDKLSLQISYVRQDSDKDLKQEETDLIEFLLNSDMEELIANNTYQKYDIDTLMNTYAKLAYIANSSEEHYKSIYEGTNYGYFEDASNEKSTSLALDNSTKSFSQITEFMNEALVAGKGLGMCVLMSGIISKTFMQYLVTPDIKYNNDLIEFVSCLASIPSNKVNEETFKSILDERNISNINSLIQVTVDASKLLANSILGMKLENYKFYLWVLGNKELSEAYYGSKYNRNDVVKLMLELNNNQIVNKLLLDYNSELLTNYIYEDKVGKLPVNNIPNNKNINEEILKYFREDKKMDEIQIMEMLNVTYNNYDFIEEFKKLKTLPIKGIDDNGNLIIDKNITKEQLIDTLMSVYRFRSYMNYIRNNLNNLMSIYGDYSDRRPNIINKEQVIKTMSSLITKNYNAYLYDMIMFEEVRNNYILDNIFEGKRIILNDYIKDAIKQNFYADYLYIDKLEKSFKELTVYKLLKDFNYFSSKVTSKDIKEISILDIITGNHIKPEILSKFYDVLLNTEIVIGNNKYKLSDYIQLENNKRENMLYEKYRTDNRVYFDVSPKFVTNTQPTFKVEFKSTEDYNKFKNILFIILNDDTTIKDRLKLNKIDNIDEVYEYMKRLFIANLYLDNSEYVPTAIINSLFNPIAINEMDKKSFNELFFNKFIYDLSYNKRYAYYLDVKRNEDILTSEDMYEALLRNINLVTTKANLPKFTCLSDLVLNINKTQEEKEDSTKVKNRIRIDKQNPENRRVIISNNSFTANLSNIKQNLNDVQNKILNLNNKKYNEKVNDILSILNYNISNVDNINKKKYYLELMTAINNNLNVLDFGINFNIIDDDKATILYADIRNKTIFISKKALNNMNNLSEEFIEEILHVISSANYKIDNKIEQEFLMIKKDIINNLRMFINNDEEFNLIKNLLIDNFNESIKDKEIIKILTDYNYAKKVLEDNNHKYNLLAKYIDRFYSNLLIENTGNSNSSLNTINYYDIGKSFLKMMYGLSDVYEFIPNIISASKNMNIFLKKNILEYVNIDSKEKIYMNKDLVNVGNDLQHFLLRHIIKAYDNEIAKKISLFHDSLGLLNENLKREIC